MLGLVRRFQLLFRTKLNSVDADSQFVVTWATPRSELATWRGSVNSKPQWNCGYTNMALLNSKNEITQQDSNSTYLSFEFYTRPREGNNRLVRNARQTDFLLSNNDLDRNRDTIIGHIVKIICLWLIHHIQSPTTIDRGVSAKSESVCYPSKAKERGGVSGAILLIETK